MLIAVTGVPGTGKTLLSQALARELGFLYVSGATIIETYGLREDFDVVRDTYHVSVDRFCSAVVDYVQHRDAVVDSHLSHYLSADVVVVCTCPLPVLKERLQARHYSLLKIEENLTCEAFHVCYGEALEEGRVAFEVDTSQDSSQILHLVKEKLKSFLEE